MSDRPPKPQPGPHLATLSTMLNVKKNNDPEIPSYTQNQAQNGAKKGPLFIFLTVLSLTLISSAISQPTFADPKQTPRNSHLKLVADNSKSMPETRPVDSQTRSVYILPRKEDPLSTFLQLSKENILESSILDRALLAAHQLTFAKPENKQSTESQLLAALNITTNELKLAQFFLQSAQAPTETQNTANIFTEFLARSTPTLFQVRFLLVATALKELSLEIQNTTLDQITPLVLEHILTDPYLSLSANLDFPRNFAHAQEARNQLIENFDTIASDTQRRLLYFELYEHFRTIKTDATASRSQAQQFVTNKMTALLKADPSLARTLKSSLFRNDLSANTESLDALDNWYTIFVAHRLITPDEHQDIVSLYKQYLNISLTRPYVNTYPNFESRLDRYLGFLDKNKKLDFAESFLISSLISHNFLTDYKFETQEFVAKESYKIYLKLFDLTINNRTSDDTKKFLLKLVPAYMTSLPHYKVPNIDFEKRLIEEVKKNFTEHNTYRAQLLDILDRSVTAASQRQPRILKELRPLFNDDLQQIQRFDKFYTHVLRNQVRSKAMMPNLQPDAFREAQNELFYLSRVLPDPQYYDFLSSLLNELRYHTKKLPNPFQHELEYEFSSFKGQRPKDRPPLILIDCRKLISK
jgi:hypothetical protein